MPKHAVPIWGAMVEGSRLRIAKLLEFTTYLRNLNGKEVKVMVAEKKYIRSLKQNAYYWGPILEICSNYTGFTKEECHQVFKERFLVYSKEYKGKNFEFTRSTSDLDTKEFSEYIEKIKLYMAQEHEVQLPEAGEYGEL